jgi:hypothetical protein
MQEIAADYPIRHKQNRGSPLILTLIYPRLALD